MALLLLAAPLAQAEDVVIGATEDDAGDWPDKNLDIVQACMADRITSTTDGKELDAVKVCLKLGAVNVTEIARAMWSVEFTHGARYRVQANYTSEAIDLQGELVQGWFWSLEKNTPDGWETVEGGISDFDIGDDPVLWWTIPVEKITNLDPGDKLEDPKAFTYLKVDDSEDVDQTVQNLLSDQLDQDSGEGTTVTGWSIADIAPGGTGSDYQQTEPADRTYGEDHEVAPGLTGSDDGGGDDGTSNDNNNQNNQQNNNQNTNNQNGGGGDGTDTTDPTDDNPDDPGTGLIPSNLLILLGIVAAIVVVIALAVKGHRGGGDRDRFHEERRRRPPRRR